MKMNNLHLNLTFVFWLLLPAMFVYGNQTPVQIILNPQGTVLMTDSIQAAINKCTALGGGTVVFPKGQYLSGGLELKSNITLQFQKGAILQGSDKYANYNAKQDAFIFGRDITNITIQGEGEIDGVDCYNPKGEEGFRGPHCIRLINCKNITIKGITIKRSANWAINCRLCSNGYVENVTILGGHDGLHTRFCEKFTAKNCDFRTGDDSFAGNDNRDFVVTDCKINTSCNGFRFGCQNFVLERCKFWGPGEYVHKIQKRFNMQTAFVHFSPKDDKSKIPSSNWVIRDITIENVDHIYMYNYENGLWQTGQPAKDILFENVKASGLLCSFGIRGDKDRQFNLTVKNSTFKFRDGAEYKLEKFEGVDVLSHAFMNANNFGTINFQNVTFEKQDTTPLLTFTSGNKLSIKKLTVKNEKNKVPYIIEKVDKVKK